jgi:glutaredoxin
LTSAGAAASRIEEDREEGVLMENQPRIVIYTTPKCPDSTDLKKFLKDNNFEFRDRNIETDYEAREQLNNVLKAGNKTPGIMIGNKPFIGFARNAKAIRRELGVR